MKTSKKTKHKNGHELNVLLGAAVAIRVRCRWTSCCRSWILPSNGNRKLYTDCFLAEAHDGLLLMDGQHFVDCNASALRIYGVGRERLIGASPLDFSPERQPDGTRSGQAGLQRIKAAIADTPQLFEWRHLRGDGSSFDAEISLNCIQRGGKRYLLAMARDITDRKQTQEALHRSEHYLSSIFRTVPTGIGVVRNRRLETVNDRFCEIFGCTRRELLENETRKLYISEDEFQRCGKEIYDQLDQENVSTVEAYMIRKDGREITVLINSSRLNTTEKDNAVISSILDITALKQAEEQLRASEERFKALHNASFGGIAIHNKGVILDCNQGLSDITGYSLDELIGMDGLLLIAERFRDKVEDMVRERTEELTESNAELQRLIQSSDDRSKQAAILNEMGELLQACETEEETYHAAKGVCAKLFPQDSGCIGILDAEDGNINIVGSRGNAHSCSTEFTHNDFWAIRRGKAHMVLKPETEPLCNHVRDKPECGTVCIPMSAQGKVLGIAHMLFERTLMQYQEVERQRIIGEKCTLLAGLVERYAPSLVNLRLRESLREQSIRDRLTGLYNRRHMETALGRELARARRRGTAIVVVMIDVDHFKRFNDTYGHETGDEVLRQFGSFLMSQVRLEDIPCRYGGEELLFIMPDCSMKDGLARAESIRRGIEEEVMVVYNGERLQVTASLGVASYPVHGEEAETVIAAADKALYIAKEMGRNKVAAYSG